MENRPYVVYTYTRTICALVSNNPFISLPDYLPDERDLHVIDLADVPVSTVPHEPVPLHQLLLRDPRSEGPAQMFHRLQILTSPCPSLACP